MKDSWEECAAPCGASVVTETIEKSSMPSRGTSDVPTKINYLPLFLVFLSGIGFSFQSLIIKTLSTSFGFAGSFQIIFVRGLTQGVLALMFIYHQHRSERATAAEDRVNLFGNTRLVKLLLFLRSGFGYGGIAFAFLAIERLPMGDATVLVMLSPICASLCSWAVLGEPWRVGEIAASATAVAGVCFVSRPAVLFGGGSAGSSDALGVLYALLAAAFAGFAYTTVRMLGTTNKMPWANVCLSQAIGQVLLSPPSLLVSGQSFRLDAITFKIFGLIWIAGFIGAWSQISMTIGMQREKSALATGMRMSDVLFGFLWQALFTSDSLNPLSVVGAFLVTASVVGLIMAKAYNPGQGAPVVVGGSPEVYSAIHMDSTHSGSSAIHMDSTHSESKHSIDAKTPAIVAFSIVGDEDEDEVDTKIVTAELP